MGSGLSQRFLYGSERGTVHYDREAACTVPFGKGTKKQYVFPLSDWTLILPGSIYGCWSGQYPAGQNANKGMKKKKHRTHVYSWPKGVRFCFSASRATLSTAREDRDTDYGFTPSAWYISFGAIPGTVSALADLLRLR